MFELTKIIKFLEHSLNMVVFDELNDKHLVQTLQTSNL